MDGIRDVTVPEEWENFVNLQFALYDAKEDDFDDVIEYAKQVNEGLCLQLFLRFAGTRVNQISLYIKMFKELLKIYPAIIKDHPDKIYYYDLYFLRHCYDEGLIEIDDVRRVTNYEEYFIPELNFVRDEYNLIDATGEELKKDDWKLFKEYIKYGGPKNSLRAVIRRDDIDALSLGYAKSEFSINSTINGCSLDGLGDEFSLINLAATYGAVQCFKFLLLHGAELTDQVFSMSIFGGNLELLHICEQEGIKPISAFSSAIRNHQYEAFDWIVRNWGVQEVNMRSRYEYCLNAAAFYYLNPGADANSF